MKPLYRDFCDTLADGLQFSSPARIPRDASRYSGSLTFKLPVVYIKLQVSLRFVIRPQIERAGDGMFLYYTNPRNSHQDRFDQFNSRRMRAGVVCYATRDEFRCSGHRLISDLVDFRWFDHTPWFYGLLLRIAGVRENQNLLTTVKKSYGGS